MDDIAQREMTLEEWVGRLPESHTARKEWAGLRERIAELEKPRTAPVLGTALRIPWSVFEKAYVGYADKHGRDQSIERTAERGGLAVGELDVFHPTWRAESEEIPRLQKRITSLKDHLDTLERANSMADTKIIEQQEHIAELKAERPHFGTIEIVKGRLQAHRFTITEDALEEWAQFSGSVQRIDDYITRLRVVVGVIRLYHNALELHHSDCKLCAAFKELDAEEGGCRACDCGACSDPTHKGYQR